jgi:hypothetical protein
MPNETGRLAGVAVARSRSHYVAYGVDAARLAGRSGLHGVLPSYTAYSASSVLRELVAAEARGDLTEGMAFEGHRTGPSPVCFRERNANVRCEQRFAPLTSVTAGPAVLAVPLQLLQSTQSTTSTRLPMDLQSALSRARTVAPRAPHGPTGPVSERFFMPSGLYTDEPPAPSLPSGIQSFGVEFECGVPDEIASAADNFVRRCSRAYPGHDGSVTFGSGFAEREYTFWSTSIPEVTAWLSTLYAAGIRTNSSCGFHVHIRPMEGRLWVPATRYYWDGFGAAYRQWTRTQPAKFWARATDEWCRFQPWRRSLIESLLETDSDRYTAINLSSLVRHRYGTIEHRILPYQANLTEATSSINWLLSTAGRLISAERIPVEDAELDLLANSSRLLEPVHGGQETRLYDAIKAVHIPRASTPCALPWEAASSDLEA